MKMTSMAAWVAIATLALTTGESAADFYIQDFTAPDGTTDLGDGTTIGSSDGVFGNATNTNQVLNNALRMTAASQNNTRSSFRIPALPNSSLGWTATFDFVIADAVGGNPPADGFTFNYGDIPALSTNDDANTGHGAAEAGMGGNVISFQVDTWRHGDAGNSPGVGILLNGALLPGGRVDGTVVPANGSVSGSAMITFINSRANGLRASFSTTGLATNAEFSELPLTFHGNDAYSWAFSARTGGAAQDLTIDNLCIVTAYSLSPNVCAIPEPSAIFYGGLISSIVGCGVVVRRRCGG